MSNFQQRVDEKNVGAIEGGSGAQSARPNAPFQLEEDSTRPPRDAHEMMGGGGEGAAASVSAVSKKIGAGFFSGMESVKGLVAPMGQKLPFSRIFGGAPAKKEAAPVDPGSYVPPNMDGTPANRGGAAPPGAPAQVLSLRCFACQTVMNYPPGSEKVRCPACTSINACPASNAAAGAGGGGAASGLVGVLCSRCNQKNTISSGVRSMVCTYCSQSNQVCKPYTVNSKPLTLYPEP
ncbi:hypothetical protein T484DRAFT_3480134 [Baffinella frigidus]|nr:hypothetical protein T484DRAFT_3480134 [Cryptophyta sp. CCMP2293]